MSFSRLGLRRFLTRDQHCASFRSMFPRTDLVRIRVMALSQICVLGLTPSPIPLAWKILSVKQNEKALTEAKSLFLSSFAASDRSCCRTSGTARSAKAASERARWEHANDAGGTRQVESVLGLLSGHEAHQVRAIALGVGDRPDDLDLVCAICFAAEAQQA